MTTHRIFGETLTGRDIAVRYPQFFQGVLKNNKTSFAIFIAATLIYLFGWYSVGVSFERLVGGFSKFGWIIGLMLPPHPGSLHLALVFFHGLIETL